jgi:hypothetical protein
MNIPVVLRDGRRGMLTTEHSQSSYNQPVLLIEGIAYGPGDGDLYIDQPQSDAVTKWNEKAPKGGAK